jgi:hypothetical protein
MCSSPTATPRRSTTTTCAGAEICDRPRGDGAEDPVRLRLGRQRHADQQVLSAVHRDGAAHLRSGQGRLPLQEVRPFRLGPAAHLGRRLPGRRRRGPALPAERAKAGITIEIKREPGDGYWSEVWNKQPFSTSYWGGRPTQDQMYSTAYYSKADWNDTRFFNEKFDQMLFQRAPSSTRQAQEDLCRHGPDRARRRRRDHADVQRLHRRHRPEGRRLDEDGNQEMMGGYALSKCWLAGLRRPGGHVLSHREAHCPARCAGPSCCCSPFRS